MSAVSPAPPSTSTCLRRHRRSPAAGSAASRCSCRHGVRRLSRVVRRWTMSASWSFMRKPLYRTRRIAGLVVPDIVHVAVGVADHRSLLGHLFQKVGVQLRLLPPRLSRRDARTSPPHRHWRAVVAPGPAGPADRGGAQHVVDDPSRSRWSSLSRPTPALAPGGPDFVHKRRDAPPFHGSKPRSQTGLADV